MSDQSGSDGSSLFADVIQGDPDICTNCFRRTHDRYERNFRVETYFDHDAGEWSTRPVEVQGVEIELPGGETEVVGGKDDEVYRHRECTRKIPEKGGHRGFVTVCECGFRFAPPEVVDDWRNRPLDKATFLEYAEHLKERLREAGVDFDEAVFDEFIREKKSDPDEQFADDGIYSDGIEFAMKASEASLEA